MILQTKGMNLFSYKNYAYKILHIYGVCCIIRERNTWIHKTWRVSQQTYNKINENYKYYIYTFMDYSY